VTGHTFPEGAERCVHCGTLASQIQRTACPGGKAGTTEGARPEPTRRVYASEDWDAIGARQAELRAEHDGVLNQPARSPIASLAEEWLI